MYLYYISVSLRLMFFNFYLWIFDLCVVFCRQLSFFVLWSLQTLKMNDKYFRRCRINAMTSIFLWWIFISFHQHQHSCVWFLNSYWYSIRNQLCALLIWVRTVQVFALLFVRDTCVCIVFIVSLNHGFIRIFLLNKDCLFNNTLRPNYSNSISSVEKASNKR